MWPNNRALDLFGIELPIIQAPMAGSAFSDMAVTVSEAGRLGSLACALLSVEQARRELETIRGKTSRPINLNFFCHQSPHNDPAREMIWRRRLDAYYAELGLEKQWCSIGSSNRSPFDDKMCDLVLEFHPFGAMESQVPFASHSAFDRPAFAYTDFSNRTAYWALRETAPKEAPLCRFGPFSPVRFVRKLSRIWAYFAFYAARKLVFSVHSFDAGESRQLPSTKNLTSSPLN